MNLLCYCRQESDFGYNDVDCIGLANSVLESEWNTVFERYKLLTDRQLEIAKQQVLFSLSCSRNSKLLERSVLRLHQNLFIIKIQL